MTAKFKAMNFFNVLLLLIAIIQYYLLAPLNSPGETYITTSLDFDVKLKLIPGFLIPYYSVYILFILMIILIIRNKESWEMTIFLTAVILLWSLVNFAHGFFPTQNTIRPQITETGFFFEAVKSLYTGVKPFRTLPSWHAATAVLCAIVFFKMKFRRGVLIIIWCFLIVISPMFLKMAYAVDVIVAIPLAYLSYAAAKKISTVKVKTETLQEIVKAFTLESLIQSVAIGIRDESTLVSLIEGLTRIEKNLTDNDKAEIKKIGAELNPPVKTLKEVINNLILSISVERHVEKAKEMFSAGEKSYIPSDRDLKSATEELVSIACRPFDNPKFRFVILEIKKNNTQIINTNSLEEAAKERSSDIIFKFNSFLESHKTDIPVINTIANSANSHIDLTYDELKMISKELRKPPYEITIEEIWSAYQRIDGTKVKPLGDLKSNANIIILVQYALGKIDTLEPYVERIDKKFNEWLDETRAGGREYTTEELEWLKMMKNHFSTFLEINMTSFNQPPFVNKGGASKAYNIFGHDLNKILYELNERLI
ncbi:MAG TPA: type I restriction-modification enzyme R subunit C-terminal domain-containing protein [Ignavibacteria bacterium]|nr:type I restriction-modification enzyme R subunit C-terminal domain-containing protein [Ignavibacteria bacterium]